MNTDTPTTTATSTRTGPAPAPGPAHPRRVLLVTGGIGEGHHAAARAVEERARRAWPGVEVVWTDTLDGMGRGTGPVFRAIYAGCMRRFSWLYELYFWLLWHVRPFRAGTRAVIGAWSGRGLARQLARHSPDLVVATFPEGITGLGALRRRGRLPMPAVAVMADPAPHPLWVDPGLDLHLVSTGAATALVRRAAPDARVRVAALPVSSRFTPPPVEAARARPQVYVSCGSMAFGDVAAACAAVLDAGADVLVSSGRNAAVRRRLCAVGRTHPRGAAMRVVDWVDDPAAATRDCDVVVANASGATTLEALACARPLLLFAPIVRPRPRDRRAARRRRARPRVPGTGRPHGGARRPRPRRPPRGPRRITARPPRRHRPHRRRRGARRPRPAPGAAPGHAGPTAPAGALAGRVVPARRNARGTPAGGRAHPHRGPRRPRRLARGTGRTHPRPGP
ncbi:MGDG synthase family glycosyltransferase [Pseudonocardia xinjiangensis]|uniref:MGDG synthase family glycosyltransferase n=1 Tax=Pseudonocardia xinjiangensis TaxID=75289 RepID=UPI003D8CB858